MNKENICIMVDMENTIVDTSKHLVELIHKSIKELGKDADKTFILKNLHEFNNILNPLNVNPTDFWKNIKKFENRIEGVKNNEIYLYPDTEKFLKFASDFKLILLTDVEEINTLPILNLLKIEKYFDAIMCAKNHILNESDFKKPNINFVKHAMKKANFDSGHIFYVGDSESDYQTTNNMKNAGLNCTFILIKRYSDTTGDIVVNNLDEAISQIKLLLEK